MPSRAVQSGGQDWGAVDVGRGSTRRAAPRTASGITAAKKAGLMATEKRYGAGGNASAHTSSGMSARKLEESDELKHAKVDRSLSKAIMQARMAKKMTQKQLATAINEKPQVVAEYENGKAIPNGQIIVKIERKLACKLPRPGKKPAAKKTAAAAGRGGAGIRGRVGASSGGPPKRR